MLQFLFGLILGANLSLIFYALILVGKKGDADIYTKEAK